MRTVIFIFTAVLLVFGLYVFRVALVQQLIPAVANYYGMHVNEVVVGDVGAGKIMVNRLSLASGEGSTQLQANVEGVLLRYEVRRRGIWGVSSIEIDDLDVNVMESSSSQNKTSSTPIKDYLKLLPDFAVDIKRLAIRYRHDNKMPINFNGSLQSLGDIQLSGRLDYSERTVEMVLSLDESLMQVSLVNVKEPKEKFEFESKFQVVDHQLQIDIDGDYALKNSATFLNNLQSAIVIKTSEGKFEAKLAVDLDNNANTAWNELDARFALSSNIIFSSPEYSLLDAQAVIRGECFIAMKSLSHCHVTQPQRLNMRFESVPVAIRNYVGIESQRYQLELRPDESIHFYRHTGDITGYIVEGDANLLVNDIESDSRIELALTDINLHPEQADWVLQSNYRVKAATASTGSNVKAKRVIVDFAGKITIDQHALSVYIDKGATAELFGIQDNDILVNRLRLKQSSHNQLNYRFENKKLWIDRYQADLDFSGVYYQDVLFDTGLISLVADDISYHAGQHAFRAKFSTKHIKVNAKGLSISGAGVELEMHSNEGLLAARGQLLLGKNRVPVHAFLNYDGYSNTGNIKFESKKIALKNNEIVSQAINMTGLPLHITAGDLMLEGQVNLTVDENRPRASVGLDLSASEVAGDYANSPFEGLNFKMSLMENDGWRLQTPAALTIDALNIGVPLYDIHMLFEQLDIGVNRKAVVKVVDFYAGALDGSIFSQSINIDLNKHTNEFTIYLTALSLAKLVEINQTEALMATGMINGRLPMKLEEGMLQIDDGWVSSDDHGGVIRYRDMRKVLKGSHEMQLVAEVLEDFRYSEMSARVNLNPEGVVRLNTKLHGRSPHAKLDKPVNLNFNIDFDLWKFLESARLLSRMGQDIVDQADMTGQPVLSH